MSALISKINFDLLSSPCTFQKETNLYKPRYEKPVFFCICENKDVDQHCAADQRLCFRYTDSTIPLLPKSEIAGL